MPVIEFSTRINWDYSDEELSDNDYMEDSNLQIHQLLASAKILKIHVTHQSPLTTLLHPSTFVLMRIAFEVRQRHSHNDT